LDERTKDKLGYDQAIKDLNAISKSLAIFSKGDIKKEKKWLLISDTKSPLLSEQAVLCLL
jgi:hypothetical protein